MKQELWEFTPLVQVKSGRRVLFLPTFLFGATQQVLDSLYGSADEIPTIGINRVRLCQLLWISTMRYLPCIIYHVSPTMYHLPCIIYHVSSTL